MRTIRDLMGLAIRFMRRLPFLRCGHCDHWFDRRDGRAFAPQEPRCSPRCPACQIFDDAGGEAWGIANDCQGIFADAVFYSKAEAVAAASSPPYDDAECYAVPVKVLQEPADRVWWREHEERERLGLKAST